MFRICMPVLAGLLLACALPPLAEGHDRAGHAMPMPPEPAPPSEAAITRLEHAVDLEAAKAPVLQVELGTTVMLTVHGAGRRKLHLHGYDIESGGDTHLPAVFLFEARHAGRFPVVMHVKDDLLGRGERAVLYVEVRAP